MKGGSELGHSLDSAALGDQRNQTAELVTWYLTPQPVEYAPALALMEAYVEERIAGRRPDLIWLLEHPPLYTYGSLSQVADLLNPGGLPVFATSRGGQYTYHGPGQRVIYVIMQLPQDFTVHRFVRWVETWVGNALRTHFNLQTTSVPGKPGVWVATKTGDLKKIASLGFRFRKRVSFHGVSINVSPNLNHFAGIRPCGMDAELITSLHDLGLRTVSLEDVDTALKKTFCPIHGEGKKTPSRVVTG